ncbi:MAG: CPBP family intramembrane glutamic endopeptidase [Cyanobacteriota bacterium]
MFRLAYLPFPLRIGSLLIALLVLWLPYVALVYALVDDANTISILVMPVLFGLFFGLLWAWGRWVYGRRSFAHYGLVGTWAMGRELLQGLGMGFGSLMFLFGLMSVLGWVTWRSPAMPILRLLLEGLGVGLGYGLAEETVFRGWLLDELERDYSPRTALWANALTFAVLHFIRPLNEVIATSPQFFGLVLLGLLLVWARRQTGRLGLSIGLHGGMVWGYYVVNVGAMVRYTGQVPEWVTGINQNPLAGVLGFLCMGGLALSVRSHFRHSP